MWGCEDLGMWGFGDVKIWGCEDLGMRGCENYIFVLLGIKMLLLNYLGKMKPKAKVKINVINGNVIETLSS